MAGRFGGLTAPPDSRDRPRPTAHCVDGAAALRQRVQPERALPPRWSSTAYSTGPASRPDTPVRKVASPLPDDLHASFAAIPVMPEPRVNGQPAAARDTRCCVIRRRIGSPRSFQPTPRTGTTARAARVALGGQASRSPSWGALRRPGGPRGPRPSARDSRGAGRSLPEHRDGSREEIEKCAEATDHDEAIPEAATCPYHGGHIGGRFLPEAHHAAGVRGQWRARLDPAVLRFRALGGDAEQGDHIRMRRHRAQHDVNMSHERADRRRPSDRRAARPPRPGNRRGRGGGGRRAIRAPCPGSRAGSPRAPARSPARSGA